MRSREALAVPTSVPTIADVVKASREAQHLPDRVEDPRVLETVAAMTRLALKSARSRAKRAS